MSTAGFMRTWGALAGALPWIVLYPLVLLATQLWAQVGTLRTGGVFAVFAGMAIALSALLALPLARAPRGPRLGRVVSTALVAATAANLAAVGLSLHYHSAPLAPLLWKLAAAAVVLGVVAAFARYPADLQAFVSRALTRLGLVLVGLPLLTLPWLVTEATRGPGPTSPALVAPTLRPDAPRRVVLVSFDAWRARSTSLLTPGAPTPHLRALAARSTWYAEARAASDATLSSMTAVLTGLPPDEVFPDVGNRTGGLRHGRYTGLAGYLRAGGYATAAATMLVEPRLFGLESEFDQTFAAALLMPVGNELNTDALVPWRASLEWLGSKLTRQGGRALPYPAGPGTPAVTVDRGLAMLADAPDRAFLWLHLGAPHTPFYDLEGLPPVPQPSPAVSFEAIARADAETLRRHEAAYEAYVRYADHELGRVVRALEADPRWADTLLIVVADHGEEFVAGRTPHGSGHLTEDITRVPLVIHMPGQEREVRVDRLATHVDLVPTVLARVFTHLPDGFKGLDLGAGAPPVDRTVVAWGLSRRYFTSIATTEALAAYRLPFKLVWHLRENKTTLYDLRTDPEATLDVSDQHPEVVAGLQDALDRQIRLARD